MPVETKSYLPVKLGLWGNTFGGNITDPEPVIRLLDKVFLPWSDDKNNIPVFIFT